MERVIGKIKRVRGNKNKKGDSSERTIQNQMAQRRLQKYKLFPCLPKNEAIPKHLCECFRVAQWGLEKDGGNGKEIL